MKDDINLLPRLTVHLRFKRLYLDRLGRLVHVLMVVMVLGIGALVALDRVYRTTWRSVDQEVEQKQGTAASLESEIRSTNQFIRSVYTLTHERPAISPQLHDLLAALPPHVVLEAVARREEDAALLIEGSTSSRSALVLLEQRFTALPWVTRVEAPLKNFATETEGEFAFVVFASAPSPTP